MTGCLPPGMLTMTPTTTGLSVSPISKSSTWPDASKERLLVATALPQATATKAPAMMALKLKDRFGNKCLAAPRPNPVCL